MQPALLWPENKKSNKVHLTSIICSFSTTMVVPFSTSQFRFTILTISTLYTLLLLITFTICYASDSLTLSESIKDGQKESNILIEILSIPSILQDWFFSISTFPPSI